MNRKQFLLMLMALAVIGGAGLVLLQRTRQAWNQREPQAGNKVLPQFHLNEVAAIHVKGSSEFSVVRSNGLWQVPERGGYPVNYEQLRGLLLKIRDLKVVQSDWIGPSQLGFLELAPPGSGPGAGTLLEFKDAQGKLLDALLLGKKHDRPQKPSEPVGLHGFFDGRYVLVPSDPHNVLLVPDELANAAPDPGFWLSPEFFKIQHIKFISLQSPEPGHSWEISRESDSAPWVLADLKAGETLDPSLASQAAEILAFPRFVDVLPKASAAVLGLEKATTVTVMTDRLAYTLKVGAKRPDGNYPMTVSVAADLSAPRLAGPNETPESKLALDKQFDEQSRQLRDQSVREQALGRWVYLVDSWIELVLRDRAQLLEKKVAAAEPAR